MKWFLIVTVITLYILPLHYLYNDWIVFSSIGPSYDKLKNVLGLETEKTYMLTTQLQFIIGSFLKQ